MFIGTILDSASFNIQRNFFKKENFKENTLYDSCITHFFSALCE